MTAATGRAVLVLNHEAQGRPGVTHELAGLLFLYTPRTRNHRKRLNHEQNVVAVTDVADVQVTAVRTVTVGQRQLEHSRYYNCYHTTHITQPASYYQYFGPQSISSAPTSAV